MATPFTTFATPSRSTMPPSPLPSTERRSYPAPLSSYSSSSDDEDSHHHFTFLCTPPSRSPSSSLGPSHSLSPSPSAPLLPSAAIFAGRKHQLTSTPMKRSPGMCNLNFFTRSAMAEDSKTSASGVEAWRSLGAHSNTGLASPSLVVRAGTPDSGFFSSPELPSSPSSSYSSSPASSYFDDEDSDPSTSLDWERLTAASTPPTLYTPFTCSSTPFKSPSPADPRQQLARLQLVASPKLAGLQEEQQRRAGGSWEVEDDACVGLGLGLAF